MNEIKVLDLFSGIGGFSLGLEAAGPFRTVAFCEREPFCQAVLRKHWPDTPIYDDVRTIDTDGLGRIDLICGGFPCQPWSVAGKQRGAADDRDLWPVMASLIKDIRPQWVIGENVRGFINEPLGLERSLSDLESIGYSAVPFVIPACAVDAPHRRDRVWIIAAQADSDSKSNGTEHEQWMERAAFVGDTSSTGSQRTHSHKKISEGFHEIAGKRCDFVADPNGAGQQQSDQALAREPSEQHNGSGVQPRKAVADTSSGQCEGRSQRQVYGQRHLQEQFGRGSTDKTDRRSVERRLGGTLHDGLPAWMDEPDDIPRTVEGVKGRAARLKGLGNAIVPQIAMQIGLTIKAVEHG